MSSVQLDKGQLEGVVDQLRAVAAGAAAGGERSLPAALPADLRDTIDALFSADDRLTRSSVVVAETLASELQRVGGQVAAVDRFLLP